MPLNKNGQNREQYGSQNFIIMITFKGMLEDSENPAFAFKGTFDPPEEPVLKCF